MVSAFDISVFWRLLNYPSRLFFRCLKIMRILSVLCSASLYRAGGRMAAGDSRSTHTRREQVSFTFSYLN